MREVTTERGGRERNLHCGWRALSFTSLTEWWQWRGRRNFFYTLFFVSSFLLSGSIVFGRQRCCSFRSSFGMCFSVGSGHIEGWRSGSGRCRRMSCGDVVRTVARTELFEAAPLCLPHFRPLCVVTTHIRGQVQRGNMHALVKVGSTRLSLGLSLSLHRSS
jgi:hypothetical protein